MNLRRAAAPLSLLLLGSALLAPPAEARRHFFGFSGSRGERIDLVRDLPDTETFRRDGDYWDLGFLYRSTRAYGVTVTSDKEHGFFVLYHGDAYVKLDTEGTALLAAMLGGDPTAEYRRTQASAAEAPAPTQDTARPARSGHSRGFGAGFLGLLLLGGIYRFGARRFTNESFAAARSLVARSGIVREAEEAHGTDHRSFDECVAARLAELDQASPAPVSSRAPGTDITSSTPSMARAGVSRGFGRKVA